MKQWIKYISMIIVLGLFNQCIDPIDTQSIAFDDLLVVEALITDQPKNQVVTLSRTIPLDSESGQRFESNATVFLNGSDGRQISFIEETPGQYVTSFPFAVLPGESWQLSIETENMKRYESDLVQVVETPEIDSIYADYTSEPVSNNNFGGRFSFKLDANELGNTQYLRWTWNSTFELSVSNPSRWLWTGGNSFISRELGGANDSLQVQNCWKTETSNQILLRNLLEPGSGINALPIVSFHSEERKMLRGYSLEVKQYGLSEAGFNYWNELAEATQEQSGLTSKQVGTIVGNIRSIDEPDEVVLGIFEAVEERTVRRKFVALDFSDDGYRRRYNHFVECGDIEPIESRVDEIGETMERLGPGWTLAFFITSPPGAFYYPVRCSECTEYGSNQQPDFWE